MIFKCPVCKKSHVVNNNYDNKDYECPNNVKTFQDLQPTDILSQNNFVANRASTKVDEMRDVTITDIKPTYRTTGERIGTNKPRNW